MVMEFDSGDVIQGQTYLEQLLEALRILSPEPRYDHSAAALMIPVAARITEAVDNYTWLKARQQRRSRYPQTRSSLSSPDLVWV
jgi:hypothetical protein